MKVMDMHQWFDENIEEITWEGHKDVRTIKTNGLSENIVISDEDVVALAKEFDLIVFKKESRL